MGGRGRWISEFEASLVYKVSSRTARDPVSKKTNKKKNPSCYTEKPCLEKPKNKKIKDSDLNNKSCRQF